MCGALDVTRAVALSPPDQPGGVLPAWRSRWRRRWLWAVVAPLPLLLFLRAPHALIRPQFWAEDATVFFDQCHQHGIDSLLLSHVGYLHAAPRLIALAAHPFPVRAAPGIFAWSAFVLATATVLLVATTTFQGHRAFGPLAALGFALVPHLSYEVFWTPTNTQWTLSPLLLVSLVADAPRSSRQAWLLTIGAALAAFTSPLSTILLPCLLARLWLERSTLLFRPLAAAVAGGLVQATVMLATIHGTDDGSLPSVSWCLAVIGRRVFIQGFVPTIWWHAAGRHAIAAGFIGLALIAAGVVCARRNRLLRLVLLCSIALMVAASIGRTDSVQRGYLLDVRHTGFGDRYFIPIRFGLMLFLLSLVLDAGGAVRLVAIAGLSMVPLASVPRLTAPTRSDLHWRRYAPRIEAREAVDIPVPPDWTYHYRPGHHDRGRD